MCSAALTWLGTNSFKVTTLETEFVVDPYVCLDEAEHRNTIEDFLGADTIFITHGHFDHLCSVVDILRRQPTLVICTNCAANSLRRDIDSSDMGEDEAELCRQCIVEVGPGNAFEIDDMRVQVFQGKHIDFDLPLIAQTLSPANLSRAPQNVPHLLKALAVYPECGQTVVYDIGVAGVHIQFASLCPVDGVDYPKHADVLVIPYQGRSDLVPYVREVIERLEPKHVVLSHFDDSFPPMSQTVDTRSVQEMFENEFPEIELTIPEFGVPLKITP